MARMDAYAELQAPDVRLEDRRTGLGWDSADRASDLARQKEYASTYRHVQNIPLATRGEKLVLTKQILSGDFVSERLFVNGTHDEGRAVYGCWFDADDYAGAFAELDLRYMEGEGGLAAIELASRFLRAVNDRDLTTARSLLHDDFVGFDHRPVTGAG